MLQKIRQYISRHSLLDRGKCLIALSGGADSVCLLKILLRLGYDIEAVHCNFNLRGEESKRDEEFCVRLCEHTGVTLHRIHFDTYTYAELHKVSIEMAARELRYSYFEELRNVIGATAIAVAHHKDDNVETFLLNALRGTGIRGLEGIKPRNGFIIRPLLCVDRQEILSFLEKEQQTYITDSSNLVDDVKRNKIRLNVIPRLREVSPSATENINRTIGYVSEAVKVYEAMMAVGRKECFSNNVVDIEALKRQPSPESVLYEILKDYGFSSAQSEQVYENIDAPVGRVWKSNSHLLAKGRGVFVLGKETALPQIILPEKGNYIYNVSWHIRLNIDRRKSDFVVSKDPWFATIDADKVQFPLVVRPVKSGDRFRPYGMKGEKLVSDYLTDCHCDYFEKKEQVVVEDASGRIIWLVGRRISDSVLVKADTIKILSIRYSKE